jgi:hypothetical protein
MLDGGFIAAMICAYFAVLWTALILITIGKRKKSVIKSPAQNYVMAIKAKRSEEKERALINASYGEIDDGWRLAFQHFKKVFRNKERS